MNDVANRWWIYQRERFPLLAHGVLIAVFSLSATSYSSRLRNAAVLPDRTALLVGFGSAFLFFLQLRVLDEFKDYEEDVAYRPYRPVPRGLVTLRALGFVGIAAAVAQGALALWLESRLVVLLLVVWSYMGLMRVEFFMPHWLKAHPLAYLGSHMVIVPLIAWYVTACDWLAAEAPAPRGVGWFLIASFFNGLVVEIGRKIRVPEDEEVGVQTYSSSWGATHAVGAWLLAVAATAVCALLAWRVVPAMAVVALLSAAAFVVGIGWRFLQQSATGAGRRLEQASGVWALLIYLFFGLAPL